MIVPNHRCIQAERLVMADEEAAEASADALVQYLLKRKRGESYVEDDVARAAEIYYSKRQSRYLMEALLIAPDTSIDKIVEVMGVRKGMAEAYQKYFFDSTVFRDKFDLTDFISTLEDETDLVTKKMAVSEGFHFLVSNFVGHDLQMSPTQVCQRMQSFAYRMVTQASGAMVTSQVAKEAKHWAAIVKTFTDTLAKNDPDEQGDFLAEFKVLLAKGEKIKAVTEIQHDIVRG
jgi:hypothetical protein